MTIHVCTPERFGDNISKTLEGGLMKCLLLFQIIGRQVARAPTSIGNTYMLEVGVCVEVCDVDGRPGGTVAPLHPGQLLQLGPPQTLQRLRTKKIPNFIFISRVIIKKYQNSRPDSEIIENNVLFKEKRKKIKLEAIKKLLFCGFPYFENI